LRDAYRRGINSPPQTGHGLAIPAFLRLSSSWQSLRPQVRVARRIAVNERLQIGHTLVIIAVQNGQRLSSLQLLGVNIDASCVNLMVGRADECAPLMANAYELSFAALAGGANDPTRNDLSVQVRQHSIAHLNIFNGR